MKHRIQIIVLLLLFSMISAQKVRLSKSIYQGNDFSEVINYSYTPEGKIQKIELSQNGKLRETTTDFTFNEAGLVTGYKTIFNLKISPQKTTITYDEKNRIETFKTVKTMDNKLMKNRIYTYNGKVMTAIEPVNLSSKINYYFNDNGDIIKNENVSSSSSASTRLYDEYDWVKNPLVLTGGFIEEIPISEHNSLADHYVDLFVIKRQLIYSKKTVNTYQPGGAKIPTQQKNDLLLKAIETKFDKAYNKVMPVSTTTYQYINLK
jgi:hypothetical protein